jgi:FixJ family two-component response regulator
MTDRTPVVHVVDDDDSVRSALEQLLRAAGFEVRAYASAAEFLLGRSDENAPRCLVLDVHMPGFDGLRLQEALSQANALPPTVFLTGHGDIPTTVRAMKAGAIDFLTKPVSRDLLLAAVRTALARDAETRLAQERLRAFRARYETLTAREREVFAGVVAGKLNKQIAGDLGTAERTIKAHRAQVMEKMRVGSVAELAQLAVKLGDELAGSSTGASKAE